MKGEVQYQTTVAEHPGPRKGLGRRLVICPGICDRLS